MRLTDALRLKPGMRVAFTGAGGKSSALATLAREARGDSPIVLTTTTRLGSAQRSMADRHVVLRSVEEARRLTFSAETSILVSGPMDEAEAKLFGLTEPLLSEVARRSAEAGALLAIEADGARGRWVKAPAEHEPVIPPWVDLVVPVAGLPAVGFPLTEETAHRPERIRELLGMKDSDVLSGSILADLLASPRGGLKGVPEGAQVRVLLTGASKARAETTGEVSDRLLENARIRAVISADLTKDDPVVSADGRVAGVVLAGGSGERYGGPKQVAEWKGRPLIDHVVRAAKDGGLSPIVVVIGARAKEVRAAVEGEAILVENPAWRDGQSTSVVVGLAEVEQMAEAVVFLLADMPRVSAATIRRLVEAHRDSLPSVVAPVGGGRRGNPVLFDRRVFPALYALTGDQGGRSLLDRWAWRAIEADPAEFAEVDRPEDLADLGKGE